MTPEQAINIVARHVLASIAEDQIEWEDYPEIGENDWEAIVEAVKKIARWPDDADYYAAYELLEKRATIDEPDKKAASVPSSEPQP